MSILGLSGGGGGAYVRFMPSANAWVLGKDEIQLKKVLFDFDTLKTGWGMMAEGQAPSWVWDESIGKRSARPGDDYKRGFSIMCFFGPGKGWAEWSSTGTGPCMGFEALAAEAMPQHKENAGKVAAAVYEGSRPEKVGKGNTRVPLFSMTGWVDKPEGGSEAPAAVASSAPPSTGSTAVPPPAKKAAVTADADFG